jgi:hypothetical protein
MALSESARELRALFDRLRCFKVKDWGTASDKPFPSDVEIAHLSEAHVVSSQWRTAPEASQRHALVIDIDHPSWLVKSSTPGHYHLYVDVPGGIPHETYLYLLGALAQAGVIEQGYHDAACARGHSDVRLPWVKKPDQTAQTGAA